MHTSVPPLTIKFVWGTIQYRRIQEGQCMLLGVWSVWKGVFEWRERRLESEGSDGFFDLRFDLGAVGVGSDV